MRREDADRACAPRGRGGGGGRREVTPKPGSVSRPADTRKSFFRAFKTKKKRGTFEKYANVYIRIGLFVRFFFYSFFFLLARAANCQRAPDGWYVIPGE